MSRRIVALAAGVLLALLLTGGSSAHRMRLISPLAQFPGIRLELHGPWVPGDAAHRGQSLIYQVAVHNLRPTSVGKLGIDISLPQQRVDSTQLILPPHGVALVKRITGPYKNHLVYVVKSVPGSNGFGVNVMAHVLKTAKGSICNKFIITLNGRRGNYSNYWDTPRPCTSVK